MLSPLAGLGSSQKRMQLRWRECRSRSGPLRVGTERMRARREQVRDSTDREMAACPRKLEARLHQKPFVFRTAASEFPSMDRNRSSPLQAEPATNLSHSVIG